MSNSLSKGQLLPATKYYSSGSNGQRHLNDNAELAHYAAPTASSHAGRLYHDMVSNGGIARRNARSENYLMVGQQTIGSRSNLALLNYQERRNMFAPNVFAFNPSSSVATLGSSCSPLLLSSSAAVATPTEGPDCRTQVADIYANHQCVLLSSIQDTSLFSRPATQQLLSALLTAGSHSPTLPQSRLQLTPTTFPSQQASFYNMVQASQAPAAKGGTSLESRSAAFVGGLGVNTFLTRSSPLIGAPPVTLVTTATSSKLALNDPLFGPLQHAEGNMTRIVDPAPIRRGTRESFPMVLHRVLVQLELSKEGTRIAIFLLDGKSFQIMNHFLFEKEVLPVFFPRMRGFASFQRQLNLYDFKRVGGAGFDRGAYRHELFDRDSPAFSSKMKRRKRKLAPLRSRGEAAASSTKVSQIDISTAEKNEPSSVAQDQAQAEFLAIALSASQRGPHTWK